MSEYIFGETGVPVVATPDPTTPQGIKDFLAQAGTFDIDEGTLVGLEAKYSAEKIPTDLSKKENYQLVKTVLAKLRKRKKSITDQHKLYKAPVLEYGRRLDEIKREATPRVQALLDAWKTAQDEYDAEQERIAQEKAQAEADRINKIESRIRFLRDLPSEYIGESSEQIERAICELEGYQEDFQEFAETGEVSKKKALKQLCNLLESAKLKEEQERIAADQEEARKKKEAEDRERLKKEQAELELKQEAADLTASVANFVLASSAELKAEIDRVDHRYKDAPQELTDAAFTVITTLKSLIPAAEQRESVERQQREQEAERQRLEGERRAEEERKTKEEADRVAAEAKERQDSIDIKLYQEACELAKTSLTCEIGDKTSSRWVAAWSGAAIIISLGEPDLLNKVDDFINEQKRIFATHEKARAEAECRRAEDMGQTVADIMDCLNSEQSDVDISVAEVIADAIINGEISHVFWSNE